MERKPLTVHLVVLAPQQEWRNGMQKESGKEGVRIVLAEVKGPVRDKFHKSGMTEKLGEKHFFVTVDEAFNAIQGQHSEDTPGIALQTNALGGQ